MKVLRSHTKTTIVENIKFQHPYSSLGYWTREEHTYSDGHTEVVWFLGTETKHEIPEPFMSKMLEEAYQKIKK